MRLTKSRPGNWGRLHLTVSIVSVRWEASEQMRFGVEEGNKNSKARLGTVLRPEWKEQSPKNSFFYFFLFLYMPGIAIFSIQIKMFSLIFSIPPVTHNPIHCQAGTYFLLGCGSAEMWDSKLLPPITSSPRLGRQMWSFIQQYSSYGAGASNISALSPIQERVADYEPFTHELEGDTTE